MDDHEGVLGRLDEETARRARSALRSLMSAGRQRGYRSLAAPAVQDFLGQSLSLSSVSRTERHEIAWALGDFFEAAGMPALAAMCRDPGTHAQIAAPAPSVVRRDLALAWTQRLRRGSDEFWDAALQRLEVEREVPSRLELALTPVRALLDAVGDGLTLTNAGYLPPKTALALDTRFGWSDEYAAARPRGEADLPALLFLHEHLREQGLLLEESRTLTVSPSGRQDSKKLWAAVVAPWPRWQVGFEEEALALMASTLLRSSELTRDQLRDEMAYLIADKWQGTGSRTVDDGIRSVELAWFRVGVTLGWWNREGGLWSAKVRLSEFGRAAAASVFWAVAAGSAAARPTS